MYKTNFEQGVSPTNLAMLINSYIHRTDLNIARTPSGTPQSSTNTLKMPVINITGSLSPHADDTVTFNGRLDPKNSSWMKVFMQRHLIDSNINKELHTKNPSSRFPIVQWYSKNNRES